MKKLLNILAILILVCATKEVSAQQQPKKRQPVLSQPAPEQNKPVAIERESAKTKKTEAPASKNFSVRPANMESSEKKSNNSKSTK